MVDVRRKGQVGSTEIRLAGWLPPNERYQRRYKPIVPLSERAAAGELLFNAEPTVRTWVIRSWRLGEGEDLWTPGAYREGDRVRPVPLPGDGLQLTRKPETETPGSFDTGHAMGLGQGSLWFVGETAAAVVAWEWAAGASAWAAPVTLTGHPASAITVADGSATGSSHMFSSANDNRIYRWTTAGVVTTHYNTGTGDDFVDDAVLLAWGGKLFALDGDDLYDVDVSTADTRTLVADIAGDSSIWRAAHTGSVPAAYRIAGSDVGPVWLQRLDSGETFIWEYNVAADTEKRIGRLPDNFAFPYAITHAHGFMFVGYRTAPSDTAVGEAFVYMFRGSQTAKLGPLRLWESATTGGVEVHLPGVIGDQLIVGFDDAVWTYNLSSGGLSHLADPGSLAGGQMAVFGEEIFQLRGDGTERYLVDQYDTTAGTLTTGRFDFEYPGLRKRLLDVTIVTDPLPANTSVTMEAAVDGGAFVSLTGTHSTDNQVRFTWSAATTATDLVGYEFELRITLDTNTATNTPTVRQINATAGGAAHRLEWTLGIDCSDMSAQEIDDLNALITTGGVVTFTDPWQNTEKQTDDSFDVTVEDLITPEVFESHTDEQVAGFLKLKARDPVSGTGGSA